MSAAKKAKEASSKQAEQPQSAPPAENPELPPPPPGPENKQQLIKLNELELTIYENIHLKRELIRSDVERIAAQERDWVKKISDRVGEDVTGWIPDMQNGQLKRPQGK